MSKEDDILRLLSRASRQQKELDLGEITLPSEVVARLQPLDPGASVAEKQGLLTAFYEEIKNCTKCRLHAGRNKFVFGVGNPDAEVMFVGEGPGRDEDLQGEPFVGRAGKLLDKILAAINFNRDQVYIGNIVKCRPPENRDPESDEMALCLPYLLQQIDLIGPALICCLGRIAAHALLDTTATLGKLRGTFHEFRGRKLMVTYHPAALLRFPQYKRGTWEDVQMLRREYDAMFSK